MNLLPTSIKIAGVNHEVEYCKNFSVGSSSVGFYIVAQRKIKILTESRGEKRSIQRIQETLLHEILHGVDALYCGGDIVEGKDIIERLSAGWYTFLSNTDLKLTTLELPKRLKINSGNFEILCPYTFSDEVKSPNSVIDYEAGLIYLEDSDSEGIFNPSYLKSELLCGINYILMKEYGIDDEHLTEVEQPFTNGLYQVLVENNLNNIFRETNKRK
jgi:hypothetical protein